MLEALTISGLSPVARIDKPSLVFRKTEEYNQALHLADNMTRGKIKNVLVNLGMN